MKRSWPLAAILLVCASSVLPAQALTENAKAPATGRVVAEITGSTAALPGPGPVFRVGAAVRSTRPQSAAQAPHAGGYGDCLNCAAHGTIQVRTGDDLDARALFVQGAGKSVVLASVPLEGWFAGYQQGARLGLTDLRQ